MTAALVYRISPSRCGKHTSARAHTHTHARDWQLLAAVGLAIKQAHGALAAATTGMLAQAPLLEGRQQRPPSQPASQPGSQLLLLGGSPAVLLCTVYLHYP